jgi:hypothetical protein
MWGILFRIPSPAPRNGCTGTHFHMYALVHAFMRALHLKAVWAPCQDATSCRRGYGCCFRCPRVYENPGFEAECTYDYIERWQTNLWMKRACRHAAPHCEKNPQRTVPGRGRGCEQPASRLCSCIAKIFKQVACPAGRRGQISGRYKQKLDTRIRYT